MGILISFCCIFTLVTVLAMIIDPSRFRNGILILFCIAFWCLALVGHFFKNPDSWTTFLIVTLIMMVPICYGLITLFLFINGIIVILREGFSFSHSLSLILSLIMFTLPIGLVLFIISNMHNGRINILLCALTLIFYFMISFGGYFCYSLVYSIIPRRLKCNYIIIHGAGLLPDGTMTPLLKRRVDKALAIYYKCKKKPKIVVSGGKGSDEKISEAEAMANYLFSKGIARNQVILEKKSTNTYENLKFSKEILDEIENHGYYKCIFVTNNYHVLRTAFYARKLNLHAKGVGCHTAGYYLPSAFIREYLAVMKMNTKSLVVLVFLLVLELFLI